MSEEGGTVLSVDDHLQEADSICSNEHAQVLALQKV